MRTYQIKEFGQNLTHVFDHIAFVILYTQNKLHICGYQVFHDKQFVWKNLDLFQSFS